MSPITRGAEHQRCRVWLVGRDSSTLKPSTSFRRCRAACSQTGSRSCDPITFLQIGTSMQVTPVRLARSQISLFFVGVILCILSVYTLSVLGTPDSVIGVVAGAVLPVPLMIGEALRPREEDDELYEAGAAGGYVRPTVLVVTVAAGALFAFRSALDTLVSGLGFGLYIAGGDFSLDQVSVQLGYFWFSVIPLCFGTYFLLRGAARHLRSREHWWALGIILLCDTVHAVLLVFSGTFATREILVIHFVALICQLSVGMWAAETGRRTRLSFAAAARVRRLSGVQQEAIVDLLVDDVRTGDRGAPLDRRHVPARQVPTPFGKSLGGIGLGVLLFVATSLILLGSGVPEPLATAMGGTAGLIPSAFALARAGSGTTRDAEIRAIVDDRPTRPVLLTVFVTTLALVTVKNAILVLSFYATAGWVLHLGISDESAILILQLRYFLVAQPLFLAVGYGIIRSAAHRLGHGALRWSLVAVLSAAAIHFAGRRGTGEMTFWTTLELVEFVILAVLAVRAVHGAHRTAVPFAVRHLVRRLSPQDSAAVNDLINEYGR